MVAFGEARGLWDADPEEVWRLLALGEAVEDLEAWEALALLLAVLASVVGWGLSDVVITLLHDMGAVVAMGLALTLPAHPLLTLGDPLKALKAVLLADFRGDWLLLLLTEGAPEADADSVGLLDPLGEPLPREVMEEQADPLDEMVCPAGLALEHREALCVRVGEGVLLGEGV